jgi:hypothetical protein
MHLKDCFRELLKSQLDNMTLPLSTEFSGFAANIAARAKNRQIADKSFAMPMTSD